MSFNLVADQHETWDAGITPGILHLLSENLFYFSACDSYFRSLFISQNKEWEVVNRSIQGIME